MSALRPVLHTALLGATLVLPMSLPAQADLDRRDAVRILGGLAAIYVLSEALKRDQQQAQQQTARSTATSRSQPTPAQPGETYSHVHADGSGGGGWHEHTVGENHATARHPAPVQRPTVPQVARQLPAPAPLPAPSNRVEMRVIPTQCRVQASNAIEVIDGYDAACMQNAVVLPGSLPPQCLRRTPGPDSRAVYEASCLTREGWSTRVARN